MWRACPRGLPSWDWAIEAGRTERAFPRCHRPPPGAGTGREGRKREGRKREGRKKEKRSVGFI